MPIVIYVAKIRHVAKCVQAVISRMTTFVIFIYFRKRSVFLFVRLFFLQQEAIVFYTRAEAGFEVVSRHRGAGSRSPAEQEGARRPAGPGAVTAAGRGAQAGRRACVSAVGDGNLTPQLGQWSAAFFCSELPGAPGLSARPAGQGRSPRSHVDQVVCSQTSDLVGVCASPQTVYPFIDFIQRLLCALCLRIFLFLFFSFHDLSFLHVVISLVSNCSKCLSNFQTLNIYLL